MRPTTSGAQQSAHRTTASNSIEGRTATSFQQKIKIRNNFHNAEIVNGKYLQSGPESSYLLPFSIAISQTFTLIHTLSLITYLFFTPLLPSHDAATFRARRGEAIARTCGRRDVPANRALWIGRQPGPGRLRQSPTSLCCAAKLPWLAQRNAPPCRQLSNPVVRQLAPQKGATPETYGI